jgi:hypothetical protein
MGLEVIFAAYMRRVAMLLQNSLVFHSAMLLGDAHFTLSRKFCELPLMVFCIEQACRQTPLHRSPVMWQDMEQPGDISIKLLAR